MKIQNIKKPAYVFLILTALGLIIWLIVVRIAVTNGPIETLEKFYQVYIQESSIVPVDEGRIASFTKNYITSQFADILNNSEFEADPFLNAQDVEAEWAHNLEITPIDSLSDNYRVCYIISFDNSRRCVNVAMVQESGGWKIGAVMY